MSDGWQKVGGENDAPAWKPENEGDEVSGVFLEVRENVGANKSNIYTLQQADGSRVGVWGSAVIDNRMASIPVGDQVRIVYLGKAPSKTPGRSAYKQFEIYRKPASAPQTTSPEVEEADDSDIPF